jgi:predicted transcriptional regulator
VIYKNMHELPPKLIELHKSLEAVQALIRGDKQSIAAASASGRGAVPALKANLEWHEHQEDTLKRRVAAAEQGAHGSA